ncbi:MAG: hypothetical protein HY819_05510 [Acidobacteria bacterium]|nr:hypothetical protein [Acidobacteriota bacterium]
MKLLHSAIKSPVFELIKTIEIDIELGEDSWTSRIELFQDTEKRDYFRCRVWELELFRLTLSFPRNENGEPAHITDDSIWVERPFPRSKIDYEGFIASNPDHALQSVIEDLKNFLEHVTGEKVI